MNIEIKREAQRRGITRLCHFTPSRNLVHIASGTSGILATRKLQEDERTVFTATDLSRLDRHEGHISCSIEYHNAWYFDKARLADVLFRDWVVLLIHPKYLWLDGTKFCPRNASAAFGREIKEGVEAFMALFADSVQGASGYTFHRTSSHLLCCPTDEQAEVLIPDRVPLNDILGIVASSEEQVKNELSRFRHLGIPEDRFKFIIAPTMFKKRALSTCIRSGRRPTEKLWSPGGSNDT